ncbi:inclusion membrane protein IncB [Candidatus Chlamydia corallus]|uniref:inclusion membrane protein IncB n=1 Tax=Candidatus Chlamydia corallus TaxID=2038470 RepID=UPI000C2FCD5D|nr:inclusion membrane protein IncB [Candidatus Chlamydia corallus]
MSAPTSTPQQLSDQITCLNVQMGELNAQVKENRSDIEALQIVTTALAASSETLTSQEICAIRTATALVLSATEKSGTKTATQGPVTVRPPCTFKKVLAVVLTIIALLAIAILIACIIAVCGGFPLLLSFLNLYTVGACVSLPIIASASVALICLCVFATNSLCKPVLTVHTTK